jgi:putative Mn2+ efflux pump MntP
MDFIYILLISLALAMDCFAISICISSLSGVKIKDYFRIPLHFGLFHIAMVLIGYYVGKFFQRIITGVDHWIAFILLSAIGLKIIIDSIRDNKTTAAPTSEGKLILLSIATSVDALVIGITFAFAAIELTKSAIILGATVAIISVVGLLLGEKLHKLKLRYVGIVGGLVLIAIGLKTLLSHTLA